MKKITIVDYNMGNIDSVVRAIEECGGNPVVSYDPKDYEDADIIILPGVGSFYNGMKNLRERGIDTLLRKHVVEGNTPFLGVCLGMQLLADKGFEGGEIQGLGFIEGEIRRLEPDNPNTRIPHIGWNEVHFSKPSPLFQDIPSGKDFYFVHSYHFICKNEENILATTPYCGGFVSVVCKENIFGAQFHPEKSQRFGLQIIKNLLSF